MSRFDFIESAASSYRFVMLESRTIYHMALIPFLVKLASFVLITLLGLDTDFMRQGLILIPSYFLEGWLVAKLIRLAIFGERWPYALSGDQKEDAALYRERSTSLKASMIMYVLIKMTMAAAAGSVLESEELYKNAAESSPDPSAATFIIAFGGVLFLVWSFRLVWLYVPLAFGESVTGFLNRIKSFNTSIYMMASWFLCFIPVALLMMMFSELMGSIFSVQADVEPPILYTYIIVLAQAIFELFVAIVSSVAIAYGVGSIYQKT